MISLVKAIQERLESVCKNVYGGPAHTYASENADTYRIQDAAIAKCAAAIRAADLSDLEPKEAEKTDELRAPANQFLLDPPVSQIATALFHEATDTIAALTARLEAKEAECEALRKDAERYRLALRKIVLLDNDAHPGLFTWHDIRVQAHKEAELLIRTSLSRPSP